MTRGQVLVREAEHGDVPALSRLWETPDEDRVATSVERHAEQVDTRVVVADVDGQVAGCAYLRIAFVSPLDSEPAVHVSHLQVDSDLPSADVSAGLLEAALAWAEERGVSALLAGSAAADRDTNRFLARLGLGQVGVLRATTVPALRSRLLREENIAPRGVARGTRRTGQVVAMRRSQRRLRAGDVSL